MTSAPSASARGCFAAANDRDGVSFRPCLANRLDETPL